MSHAVCNIHATKDAKEEENDSAVTNKINPGALNVRNIGWTDTDFDLDEIELDDFWQESIPVSAGKGRSDSTVTGNTARASAACA
eukprot:1158800-Pelagomonas_calceolata.AAC.8